MKEREHGNILCKIHISFSFIKAQALNFIHTIKRICYCLIGVRAIIFYFFFFDLFIYPEESRYMMNGFRLSPAVGLAFP